MKKKKRGEEGSLWLGDIEQIKPLNFTQTESTHSRKLLACHRLGRALLSPDQL